MLEPGVSNEGAIDLHASQLLDRRKRRQVGIAGASVGKIDGRDFPSGIAFDAGARLLQRGNRLAHGRGDRRVFRSG
jgi:hypothetical protein